MRRKGTFPTKAAWLAKRERADEQPEPGLEQQPESHEEQPEEQSEPGLDEQSESQPRLEPEAKPVITLRPKRPYWR